MHPTTPAPRDPLSAIRQAEQAAAERIQQAEAEVQSQIAQAQVQARNHEQQAQLAAWQEVAASLDVVRAALVAETTQLLAAADQEATEIRTHARRRQEAAVTAILAYILPETPERGSPPT